MNSDSVRNRDLQPLLHILLESTLPNSLTDIICEYAKSKETALNLYLFLQVQGNARFEQVYLTATKTREESEEYFDILRKEFNLSPDTGKEYDDPEEIHDEILNKIPSNHYDDSNLLHLYKLKIDSKGKHKLQRKSASFIRGSNC